MTRMAAGALRKNLSDSLNRVAYRRERIILQRRGKNVAALVPVDDLKLLEELEDKRDAEDARKALAEMKAKREKPIPWEKVKAAVRRRRTDH